MLDTISYNIKKQLDISQYSEFENKILFMGPEGIGKSHSII